MHSKPIAAAFALVLAVLAASARPAPAARSVLARGASFGSVYEEDIAFALDELERRCGALLTLKGVDWREVRRARPRATATCTSAA